MNIVFMGSPAFAVPSLEILVNNKYNVVGVITSPDTYGGRGGKQLIESAVKKYATSQHIPVLQPKNLKEETFIAQLKALKPDIQIVVAFRMLPEKVWNLPPLGTYNLHGSLLPKYRGAAPINHAIINGEKETGVTSFKLKHEIDTGDILIQKKIKIDENINAGRLHDVIMFLGAEVILETVQMIEKGELHFIKQNDDLASPAPKIFHETCEIDFTNHVDQVFNFIRGLSPYPGAWCKIDGKELKILEAKSDLVTDNYDIGTIITDNKKNLKIKCQGGYLHLLKLKPEGKKIMEVHDYLNGYKIITYKTQ